MEPSPKWPNSARAAVSLTFDDAAPSQLENALPVLDRLGLRGTFYVNPGRGSRFESRIGEWRAAAARGHEIGNHTVRHPCSANFPWITPERALENWDLAEIERDVLAAGDRLQEVIPDLGPVSFAYPCGQTFVGRGAGRQSYVPVIARHFTAARGVGESANDPRRCDLHCLSSWMVRDLSGEQLVAMLEPAVELGHWAIFCFHGVGGDHIPVSTDAFTALAGYLHANRERMRTDTVQTVGEYVATARAGR